MLRASFWLEYCGTMGPTWSQRQTLERVASHREAALATDHYLVTCSLGLETGAASGQQTNECDRAAMRETNVREPYTNIFNACGTAAGNAQQTWENMKTRSPRLRSPRQRQKPWMTRRTLDLIAQRGTARSNNNPMEEKQFFDKSGNNFENYLD